MQDKILQLRKEYSKEALDKSHLKSDPFEQFTYWMEEAIAAKIDEPNAMVLSTIGSNQRPSARIVLLRDIRNKGLSFYTNYESKKSSELAQNPYACLTFFWHELERQIRIEGLVEKLPESDSDEYFALRPRGSQLGAWASPQSKEIKSRDELEAEIEKLDKRYENKTVPRPPFWGGFLLKPDYFEFWQGRESRLHDRFMFLLQKDGTWQNARLAP